MRRPGYSVNEAPDASDASETLGHFFCWAISRPCLSPPAVCLNERAVYRVAFAEPYAGSVEALFNGCALSTGATETELKRSWHLHCRL